MWPRRIWSRSPARAARSACPGWARSRSPPTPARPAGWAGRWSAAAGTSGPARWTPAGVPHPVRPGRGRPHHPAPGRPGHPGPDRRPGIRPGPGGPAHWLADPGRCGGRPGRGPVRHRAPAGHQPAGVCRGAEPITGPGAGRECVRRRAAPRRARLRAGGHRIYPGADRAAGRAGRAGRAELGAAGDPGAGARPGRVPGGRDDATADRGHGHLLGGGPAIGAAVLALPGGMLIQDVTVRAVATDIGLPLPGQFVHVYGAAQLLLLALAGLGVAGPPRCCRPAGPPPRCGRPPGPARRCAPNNPPAARRCRALNGVYPFVTAIFRFSVRLG